MSRVLGDYELLTEVARGGMGSVWMGRQKRPPRRFVAIKTILPHLAEDSRFVAMFLDETRIMSLVDHPNIVRIVDFGEHDGTLYQAMEWVEGVSLKELIATSKAGAKAIPRDVWLAILAQACDGLAAAHELADDSGKLGVVHRDVSPHNLLVGRDGTVKVIDFGVAKARDRVAGDTTSASLKGKIRYMCPEQARGEDVDPRADVWSVGVIAYQLVAGTFPYDGPTDIAVLTALLRASGAPPLPGDVPETVCHIVQRALAYDRTDRYASCRELADALRAARESADVDRAAIAALVDSILTVPVQGKQERLASLIDDVRLRTTGSARVPLDAWPSPPRPSQEASEPEVLDIDPDPDSLVAARAKAAVTVAGSLAQSSPEDGASAATGTGSLSFTGSSMVQARPNRARMLLVLVPLALVAATIWLLRITTPEGKAAPSRPEPVASAAASGPGAAKEAPAAAPTEARIPAQASASANGTPSAPASSSKRSPPKQPGNAVPGNAVPAAPPSRPNLDKMMDGRQ